MLEQYYNINAATGISIILLPDGYAEISACSIAVENKQLSFEKKITGIASIEELTKHFPAKTVMALNLAGRGILQKQIELTEDINQQNFNKILPNARIEDFYMQHFTSGNQSFISVIRKAEADKWRNQLTNLGFIPLMLSLGPFAVINVINQLNVYEGDLIFDGHTILRNEKKEWTAVSYNESVVSPFPLKVESESIPEKLLITYATAFQLVLQDKVNPVQAEVPELQSSLDKLVDEKKFKVRGFMLLAIFFVALLINFGVFSWLNSANAKLTEQVSQSAQSTEDIEKINQQVQQKETLLKTLGWEAGINKSALIDQIAALLPHEITWREVAIDPVDLAVSRSQKSVAFFNHRIRIAGDSEKIIPVNEWIARIKTSAWIKNVQLDSYTFNSELNTGQFIILIDY